MYIYIVLFADVYAECMEHKLLADGKELIWWLVELHLWIYKILVKVQTIYMFMSQLLKAKAHHIKYVN